MARPVRTSPNVKERNDPRAEEYWHNDVSKHLRLVGTRAFDVPIMVAGGVQTFTVEVQGARPNMQQTVQVGVPSNWNVGIVPYGYVSADDTVTVVLRNVSASAIDLPLMTYGVRVML